MLARALLAALGLILPASAAHSEEARLVIGAVVAKSVRFSVQGSRLEVRSNSREGVLLTFSSADPVWTSTLVLPGGVQSVDLRELRLPSWPARIVATPL